MRIICVIPARYASTRFPGKPLADIDGHPMIEWVYKRAMAAPVFEQVLVATDDRRIYNAVENFHGRVVMTPADMASGTDRIAFVARTILDADVFVNLQGDEPLIDPKILVDLCREFSDEMVQMATPIKRINDINELRDPNDARVVIDNKKNALYFTRAMIPYNRNHENYADWLDKGLYYQHIGIYAYRKETLLELAALPPGRLEQIEKLEQLRALENGYKIRTVESDFDSMSVDTREDLEAVRMYVKKNKLNLDISYEEM
jgi:3-deoxy-manno-octulosonate cytidylyltransferase (CMP-KDO synthetase)